VNEQEELKQLDNRVDIIEKQIAIMNERYSNMDELIKQNISVLSKLQDAFQDNRLAMQAMTNSIETSGKEIAGMKKDISSLKEERNLNIMSWLKNNFISIATLLAFVGYIVQK